MCLLSSVFSSLPLLSGVSGNWIEIAYGTSSGAVRVIVQHPETVGSGPQLFQTFTVHRSPVTKIMLSEKHLVSGEEDVTGTKCRLFNLIISCSRVFCYASGCIWLKLCVIVHHFLCVPVCADNNHVRTWTVTRFRGMISTQPGSTPLASFKILSLEETESHGSYCSGNDIGRVRRNTRRQDEYEVMTDAYRRSFLFINAPEGLSWHCPGNRATGVRLALVIIGDASVGSRCMC